MTCVSEINLSCDLTDWEDNISAYEDNLTTCEDTISSNFSLWGHPTRWSQPVRMIFYQVTSACQDILPGDLSLSEQISGDPSLWGHPIRSSQSVRKFYQVIPAYEDILSSDLSLGGHHQCQVIPVCEDTLSVRWSQSVKAPYQVTLAYEDKFPCVIRVCQSTTCKYWAPDCDSCVLLC